MLDNTVEGLSPSSPSKALQFKGKAGKQTSTTPPPDSSELCDLFARLNLCKYEPVVLSIVYPYSQSFVPKSVHKQAIPVFFDKKYLDMEYQELLKACSNIKLQLSM